MKPSAEGLVPFKVPSVDEPCSTFYKVFGDLSCGVPPVVGLHGGPGSGHLSLMAFTELWFRFGLPVILYDQIGCGQSTLLVEKAGDKELWREELFVAELENLLAFFKLDQSGYYLLGSSWGGMLGSAFASRRPPGLLKLVLASGVASCKLGTEAAWQRRNELPAEMRKVWDEGDASNDYSSEAYKQVLTTFIQRYVCRADHLPDGFLDYMQQFLENSHVYKTMVGRSLWIGGGSLSDWTVIPRLHQINVPTLVYNGEYDTSTDSTQTPFFNLIPTVHWKTIANTSHASSLEKPDEVLGLVGNFLLPKSAGEDGANGY
ncbi:hypothetical protein ANO11243_091520 [Dothideomycetidae sp. 11243]|nr:hypothetical protein ANO11243_091520 [fungal sp. No.11243]